MKLENDFTVPASIDEAWAFLLDVPRVAPCLPGATVEPETDEDGTYKGAMKIKIGPITAQYKGTVKIQERRRGHPHGRDARAGQGRPRPGQRLGDDHVDDGGDGRGHEGVRRHRHARHRPGRPVRPRRDAGRLRQADEALRRLPRRAAQRGQGGGAGRGRRAGGRREETTAPGEVAESAPSASSGISTAEADARGAERVLRHVECRGAERAPKAAPRPTDDVLDLGEAAGGAVLKRALPLVGARSRCSSCIRIIRR